MWLDRLNVWLLCALLALSPLAANASQNALSSPATGTVSGLQLTNNYNNALDSVNTMNSGASAPTNQLSSTPSLGNWWLNSTSAPYPAQVYDGANWLTPFWVDSVNHVTNVKIGGGVATIASASTVDPCGSTVASRAYLTIGGTTTINSFGSTCNAGHIKLITFSGALTLTYNATSMILPGAANIQTSAGDQAVIVSLGSGNWQVVSYTPANGQALINPAIDVGDYIMTAALVPPSSKYLFAYGQAISRTTYATLLTNVTITQSVTSTSGSPTLTGFSDTTQIAAGAAIEATFIPNGTTIVSCTSTTCLMSANASSSTTGNATIFPYGNGCGFGTACASPSTVFNMPDCRDVVFAGRGNMGGTSRSDSYQLTSTYFGASPNALGVFGGSQSQTLTLAQLPTGITSANGSQAINVTSNTGNIISGTLVGGVVSGAGGLTGTTSASQTTPTSSGNNSISVTSNNTSGNAHPNIQPTLTANCMVRVLAKIDVAPAQHFAGNDNRSPDLAILADRRRLAA